MGSRSMTSSGSGTTLVNDTLMNEDVFCNPGDLECLESSYEELAKDDKEGIIISDLLGSWDNNIGCHEAAHVAGKILGNLKPDSALFLNTGELDFRCDYGYIHGVFQGLAESGRDPVKEAESYCSEMENLVDKDECFHAAGHGSAIINKTIKPALESCAMLQIIQALSCLSGVYMEHVSAYMGSKNVPNYYGPTPVDPSEAKQMCKDVQSEFLEPCARKAAFFWGWGDNNVDLMEKCTKLSNREVGSIEKTRIDRACGQGVGEWLRNKEAWPIPESKQEADQVGGLLVNSCIKTMRGIDDVLLYSCIEGVLTVILPGQISSQMEESSWLDPCGYLKELDFKTSYNECVNLRTELISLKQ